MDTQLIYVRSGSPETDRIRQVRADPFIAPGDTYVLSLPGREQVLLVSPFHDRVWDWQEFLRKERMKAQIFSVGLSSM